MGSGWGYRVDVFRLSESGRERVGVEGGAMNLSVAGALRTRIIDSLDAGHYDVKVVKENPFDTFL